MLSQNNAPPPPDNPHAEGVIPAVVPPLARPSPLARDLPWRTAITWLRAGWRDLWTHPLPSLIYGLGVVLVSIAVVWFLFHLEFDYVLFPALAGFMVVGPLIAGVISDFLKPSLAEDALRYALVILALFNIWSGVHYYLGSRTVRRDIAAAKEE